jgi:hypothetical protein
MNKQRNDKEEEQQQQQHRQQQRFDSPVIAVPLISPASM